MPSLRSFYSTSRQDLYVVGPSLGFSEQATGRFYEQSPGSWKPTYTIGIDWGALPNTTTTANAHLASNLDRIVDVFGNATNGSNTLPLPYVSTVTSNLILLQANTTNISITTATDWSTYTGQVWIEFTKTTDTAVSSPGLPTWENVDPSIVRRVILSTPGTSLVADNLPNLTEFRVEVLIPVAGSNSSANIFINDDTTIGNYTRQVHGIAGTTPEDVETVNPEFVLFGTTREGSTIADVRIVDSQVRIHASLANETSGTNYLRDVFIRKTTTETAVTKIEISAGANMPVGTQLVIRRA